MALDQDQHFAIPQTVPLPKLIFRHQSFRFFGVVKSHRHAKASVHLKKRIALISIILSVYQIGSAQVFSSPEDAYSTYFAEVKASEAQQVNLWGKDMYGPMLLVNPATREVFSNFPDGGGVLKQDGEVYHGTLPLDINIANTMVHWNGRDWAMIMLPLPNNRSDRINLMAHELFHVVQSSLGFKGYSPDNSQLDDKNGRIYLRLELEALRKALESQSTYDMKKHLTDAVVFREYRYVLFPQAKITENLLELNEGLAEYTGLIVSNRSKREAIYHFETSLNAFVRYPTFVRFFCLRDDSNLRISSPAERADLEQRHYSADKPGGLFHSRIRFIPSTRTPLCRTFGGRHLRRKIDPRGRNQQGTDSGRTGGEIQG